MLYSVRMVKRASIGIIVWALLVGSLTGCGSSDTQVVSTGEPIASDPVPVDVVETQPNRIVFVNTNDEGNENIFIMDEDGSNVVQLTNNDGVTSFPAWSPDGEQIVFNSTFDPNQDIHIMDADGSNVRRLIVSYDDEFEPTWSPNGEKIAFTASRYRWLESDEWFEIYVMDADGSNTLRLTVNDDLDYVPDWSPDGEYIAFASNRDGNIDIFVMDADGTNLRQLTTDDSWDSFPDWSPDREQIAFHSDRTGNFEIFVMDADGSNVRQLTTSDGFDALHPAWSPDEKKIAFTKQNDSYAEIFVMDADGSNLKQITTGGGGIPDWAPNNDTAPIITAKPLPKPEPVPEPQPIEEPEPVEVEEEFEIQCCERWSPQWSPDSQYIAYVSEAKQGSTRETECYPEDEFTGSVLDGLGTCSAGFTADRTLEIKILDIDYPPTNNYLGKGITRGVGITGPLFSDYWLGDSFTIYDLQWSPDGKKFAYTESCTDGCYGSMYWHTAVRIFTPAQFNAEGEQVTERKLRYVDMKTDCPVDASRCSTYESISPLWTGDGQHLVFTIGNAAMFGRAGGSGGGGLLNIVDADGSNARLLPLPAGEPFALAASPDGQYIAGTSDAGMFIMNINGSDVRIFENNDDTIIEDIPATWSIDGTKIIFNRITQPEDETQGSERTVMIMNVDGSNIRQITEEEFFTYQTNISPDRTTLAYTDLVDGSREIFLVDANGENRRQLTLSGRRDGWGSDDN